MEYSGYAWALKRPIYVYYIPAKRRSGFANDIRAYKCSPPIFTVTYNGNTNTSGYVPTDNSSPYVVGSTVTVLGNTGYSPLSKSGYTFVGWNTAADGSGISYSQGNTFTITANTTLYARWTPMYTVTYAGNDSTGGSVPIDSSSPYISGRPVTVLGNTGSSRLVRTGYAFVRWNTAANNSGESYSQGQQFTITANTTLFAQWTPTYTVTYAGNASTGGSVPTDGSSPYVTGSPVTVLGNTGSSPLTKTGHTFSGWNTLANGSGTSYSPNGTFTIAANTTLYARWTAITYTVTYAGNASTGGNVPVDGSSPHITGSDVIVLGNTGSPALTKTGHTFSGWNTAANGSGTSYSPDGRFTITSNTTLFAQWTLIPTGPSPPTLTLGVGGNQAAYILFTQSGTVTNYEYSTDNGATFIPFSPAQTYSPVEINTISSDGITRLTLGTTYTVKLKAVNSGGTSVESNSITVTPEVTSLVSGSNRLIYLDANNSSSYSGSGTTWTNLESGGSYSAALNGSPTFNQADSSNKYFEFNQGSATGQYARINQATAINPSVNNPFTIQVWVKINNGSSGSLVSKMYDESKDYDGYNFTYFDNGSIRIHLNGGSVDTNNNTFYPNYRSNTGVLSSGWALYTANIQFGSGGSRQNKIFVNGRQVISATSTESSIPNKDQNLTISSGFGGDAECYIGQFYYYDRELTVTEVIQNYDASKPRYLL
jgi:uncharacterized repeat protein (TIGR02543 family)